MAVFKNTIITDAGRKVLSDALANSKKIIFTKISTSNKEYQDSVDIAKIITLENVKQTTTLSNIRQEGTKITINAVFTNSSVETAYLINTIGLYAKVEDGVEILFSITRASTADTMPANNGINLSTVEIDLVTEINNADGATIEFNPSTLVTFSTLATTESPGITKYGTEEGTALEGKELARILGVENYGGLVNTVGQKTVGKAYYDTTTKSMYICKQNNSNTYVDNNNYVAFSNSKLLDRLENLSKVDLHTIDSRLTVGSVYKIGKICILLVDSNSVFFNAQSGQTLFNIPVGYRPFATVPASVGFLSSEKAGAIHIENNGNVIWRGMSNINSAMYINAVYLTS